MTEIWLKKFFNEANATSDRQTIESSSQSPSLKPRRKFWTHLPLAKLSLEVGLSHRLNGKFDFYIGERVPSDTLLSTDRRTDLGISRSLMPYFQSASLKRIQSSLSLCKSEPGILTVQLPCPCSPWLAPAVAFKHDWNAAFLPHKKTIRILSDTNSLYIVSHCQLHFFIVFVYCTFPFRPFIPAWPSRRIFLSVNAKENYSSLVRGAATNWSYSIEGHLGSTVNYQGFGCAKIVIAHSLSVQGYLHCTHTLHIGLRQWLGLQCINQ